MSIHRAPPACLRRQAVRCQLAVASLAGGCEAPLGFFKPSSKKPIPQGGDPPPSGFLHCPVLIKIVRVGCLAQTANRSLDGHKLAPGLLDHRAKLLQASRGLPGYCDCRRDDIEAGGLSSPPACRVFAGGVFLNVFHVNIFFEVL